MSAAELSRRDVLRGGAIGGGAICAGALLAACSSSSSTAASSPTGDAVHGAAITSAGDTSSAATSSTAAATSAGAATSSAASAPSGTKVAALSDIPVGGAKSATFDGNPIVLTQSSAGTVVGFSAICPHQGGTVAPDGSKDFLCPLHGSTFDLDTGARLSGPAQSGLTKLTVTVSDSAVYVSK